MKHRFTLHGPWLGGAVSLVSLMGWTLSAYSFIPGPTASFVNSTPINVAPGAPASPYPSAITAEGVSGEITSVVVTLLQLSHSSPAALDIVLVGPGGQSVVLMSDAGGSNQVGNLTLSFTDASTISLPQSGRFVSGAYRPTNYGANDVLPAPAPPGPYGSLLAVFNGTNPNGVWRLYVADDSPLNNGVIAGGWRLDLNTTNYPPVITKQPQDQTVRPGATARFHVEVSGTPPFGFEWRRNNTQVVAPFGQAKETLTIADVQPADAGAYSVVVTNAANPNGVRSDDALLNVTGPLIVVDPLPPRVDARPGETVRFQATVAGTPPIHYQWRLNGVWLKDETNAMLTLTEVQAANGGDFSLVVWNGDEAVTLQPSTLVVHAATGPSPTDFFKDRPTLREPQGILQGNSAQATAESGEPLLLGGGKSVWFQWVAPADGIVHLTTRGTSFDTLLRVFTGTELRDLTPVVKDDDRGGFYRSAVEFNATSGKPYQVQVDGFGLGGAGGEFTVIWALEITQDTVPVILVDPVRQGVRAGDKAVFEVQTEPTPPGVPPLTYQWFFNGQPIRGATGPSFTVDRALSQHVGFYFVQVRNEVGRFALSPIVDLQLGFPPGFFFHDKPEMMFLSLGGQFVPIGVGASVFTQVPWPALSGPSDPNPCGSPFVGTLWQGLNATNSGRVQVVTTGSSILTRMAIYRLTGTTNDFGTNNPPLVCDVTSAGADQPCVATFDGLQGTNYTIVVEGYQADSGTIQVTSVMGTAPPPTNTLRYCLVASGGSVQLDLPATNWFPAPSCQWQLNHVDIPDATNTTLTVTNFSALQVGTYSVVISNFVSRMTNDVAYLALAGPFTLAYSWIGSGGGSSFIVRASNAMPFVLETATNLTGSWLPLATNPDPCLLLNFTNAGALADPQRFFRAAPWSPP